MVLFLILNVFSNGTDPRSANAERPVAFLPFKGLLNLSPNHFDEFALINRIASETLTVGGKIISICTWSLTPFIVMGFPFSSLTSPPK